MTSGIVGAASARVAPEVRASGAAQANLAYRADVDGLRAIAVLSVVLFHTGFGFVPGGFVGVDIFFVISGYLITSIIESDIRTGRFSYAGFYWRRVRRILPALLGMFVLTTAAAWFLLLPLDFKEYGQSAVAMAAFASNIYFDIKTNYFAQEASFRPLLHTWSLAVEEQYYLAVPVILLFLSRYSERANRRVILALFVASLLASVVAIRIDPVACFYLIGFRAWELLAGSLLALGIVPPPRTRQAAEAAGVAGLLLIAVGLFGYSELTRFPAEAALLPVIGAALLIHSGQAAHAPAANRLLSSRPLVFVGLISYSLYLYHWPVVVFARYATMRHLLPYEAVAALALSALLAYASWRWVELPFRHLEPKWRTRGFAIASACSALVVCFGLLAHLTVGLPGRLPKPVNTVALAALDINPQRRSCDGRTPAQAQVRDLCTIGDPTAHPSFLLFGDSFADALSPGVDAAARQTHRRGWVLTHGGCYPLVGIRQVNLADGSQESDACRAFVQSALDLIDSDPNIETIVLIGRWSSAAEGSRFGANTVSQMFILDDLSRGASYQENKDVLRRSVARTFAALRSRRVVVVAYVPEQSINVPRAMAMHAYLGTGPERVGVSRVVFDSRQDDVRRAFDSLPRDGGVRIVDIGAELCGEAICPGSKNGQPIYVDDNHLTRTEAISLMTSLRPALLP